MRIYLTYNITSVQLFPLDAQVRPHRSDEPSPPVLPARPAPAFFA
jgi:hypothetical protein